MSNLLQQLGEALNPNNTDMKDILKQEWEVFSNKDRARGVVELRDGDNDVICARMNSTNNRLLFNHLVTTHNFCKDIPDEVMKEPLLEHFKEVQQDILSMAQGLTTDELYDYVIKAFDRKIKQLTGK